MDKYLTRLLFIVTLFPFFILTFFFTAAPAYAQSCSVTKSASGGHLMDDSCPSNQECVGATSPADGGLPGTQIFVGGTCKPKTTGSNPGTNNPPRKLAENDKCTRSGQDSNAGACGEGLFCKLEATAKCDPAGQGTTCEGVCAKRPAEKGECAIGSSGSQGNCQDGQVCKPKDGACTQEGCAGTCEQSAKDPTPSLPQPPAPPCDSPTDKNGCTAVTTGFGALSTEPGKFITSLFALLLSVSGGIALLLIMKAGYLMMTAAGKPEQIQAGREQLVAAIVGLLFLIFSFVILQVIGVDILKIPGWGGGTGTGGGNATPVINTPNITTCNYSCDTAQNCFNLGGQNAGQASCPSGQICCRPK